MHNTQPPEPNTHDEEFIRVHSIFNTIQGEGPFSGRRSLFIRLAGCNLQCPGCDTEYTLSRTVWTLTKLADNVKLRAPDIDLIVITGGEPFRQASTPLLVHLLSERGYTVQVETNGTLFPALMVSAMLGWERVHVVVSPKTPNVSPALRHAYKIDGLADRIHFKYVVDSNHMGPLGLPTRALDNVVPKPIFTPKGVAPSRIYIQPYDVPGNPEASRLNRRACVASALEHGYTLQLQIHKLVGVE